MASAAAMYRAAANVSEINGGRSSIIVLGEAAALPSDFFGRLNLREGGIPNGNCKVIAAANQKDCTGKSIRVYCMDAGLAMNGRKVLLVETAACLRIMNTFFRLFTRLFAAYIHSSGFKL